MYAIWYKFSLKFSLRKWKFPIQLLPDSNIYYTASNIELNGYFEEWSGPLVEQANRILEGKFTYFSFHEMRLKHIPDWFYDPFSKTVHYQSKDHWMSIDNFGDIDIKNIWELSRFDWLTQLARAYAVTNQNKYLERLNELLSDWSRNNPLNQGPNWICGQETAIRVMKLLSAASILNQLHYPEESLKELIAIHVKRIDANIKYAIIQDNNHGTSEAAGLYLGALWLIKCGEDAAVYMKCLKKGRQILEERILKLVQKDGTFSQRSTNYHRVFVDTMSFVLHIMRELEAPDFSNEIKEKLIKAGEWQYKMTFGESGDTPNFGSNDGAMIENLHSRSYRDFRVSTQSFFGLLLKRRVYEEDSISESMFWRCGPECMKYAILKINVPKCEILDKQMLIARTENIQLFLKIPESTFRPGNDAFHIDLWVNGKPVLIDSGTYSYNDTLTKQLKSVASHNTVQYGNHEQMPLIGRFLNGEWISPDTIGGIKLEDKIIEWEGSYRDYLDNRHHRKIRLSQNEIVISDKLDGHEDAIIRYHFKCEVDTKNLEVVNGKINLSTSYNSIYYNAIQQNKCLEIKPINMNDPIIFKITLIL